VLLQTWLDSRAGQR
ncbi:MAG TPA: hypothetical protein DCQ52_17515, partial [Acidimicrobiaceae bacterium]|nr:hypothetical protein [Acidimicrobiaceae bacterium]